MAQIKKKWLKGVGQAGGLAELDANGVVPVAQLPAAVTGEAQAREDADLLLSGRLDALELDPVTKTYVDDQDAGVLVDAKAYSDQKIGDLKGAVSNDFDTLKKIEDKIQFITSNVDSAALDSLSEIVSAFQSADNTINGAITSLANSAAADVDAEESARIAADAQVLSDAKAYADGLEALDLRLDGSRAMTGSMSAKDINPVATGVHKLGNVNAKWLEGYINTVYAGLISKGAAGALTIQTTGSGEDIKLAPRSGYAVDVNNSKIKNLASGVDSGDAINKSQLDSAISGVQALIPVNTDGLSEGSTNKYFTDARAKGAAVVDSMAGSETDKAPSVSSVKSYIQAYSAFTRTKEKKTLVSGDLTAGYIDLGHQALDNSIVAFVNRVAIHEGDDYTLSVVGGKTRMTFVGEIASGGISQLEVDDVIRVTYQY